MICILQENKHKMLQINGMPDHIHILKHKIYTHILLHSRKDMIHSLMQRVRLMQSV